MVEEKEPLPGRGQEDELVAWPLEEEACRAREAVRTRGAGSGAWLQGCSVEAWLRERAGGVARGRRRLSAGGRNQRCSFCGGHGAQSLASSGLDPCWSRLGSRTSWILWLWSFGGVGTAEVRLRREALGSAGRGLSRVGIAEELSAEDGLGDPRVSRCQLLLVARGTDRSCSPVAPQ